MKPEHWQQIDKLFHSALERAPKERAAFLDQACAGDQQLRREVDALIAAHEQAGSFIEELALEVEARSVAGEQSDSGAESMVGKTVGHYRLIAALGSGGMGEVYLAQDTLLGRKVALKLLPAHFTEDAERLRRFEQEARATSALNHPNIVTIHEIGHEGSFHFIAQEFVEGVTLSAHLANERLAFNEALEVAMQVASALAAAHAKGIVHRDIKPENIMVQKASHLGRQNHVKVLDFGIAKLANLPAAAMKAEATTRLFVKTEEGRTIGTAAYMSPEQARGESVDARTDIWSLGVVIYETLTGKQPFTGDTSQDVIASILRDDLPPLPLESPEGLKWILKKALRKDRDDRYQTARELFSDLHDLHGQLQETQSSAGRSVLPIHSQIREATTQEPAATTKEVPTHTTSSAEYIIGEIKRLGRGATIVLAVLAVGGVTFGLYKLIRWTQSQTSQTKSTFSFQTMKIARLTSTGKATAAAISPDGKYVVHVVDDGNQQSLWIRQVSISSNVQISPPSDVSYLGLTFSPSGNYLYYIMWDKKNPYALYQMPVLGGTAKKLVSDIDSIVTFSPDGKQFAFVRGNPSQGEVSVILANADGTAERPLATRRMVPGPFSGPAWSPDGKVIAWPATYSDASGIYTTLVEVQLADGSQRTINSQRWWRLGDLAWLRDGSGLIFTARETFASPTQIWYVSYGEGQLRKITNDLNDYVSLSLTAESDVLVTVESERVSNIWIARNDDLRRASQITYSRLDGVEGISFTPDGRIVYTSGPSGKLDLWIMESNGTGQKQLTADAGNTRVPSVSPDGRYVVFMSDRTGTSHIWRIDIDGSNARQLTNGNGEWAPAFAPNGQWVFFLLSSGGAGKVPIDGGDTIRVIDKASGGVGISPDGKWIASGLTATKSAIYPVEGGEPHKILDIPSFYASWTPDGRALAYLDKKNGSTISTQTIDGGTTKQLMDFKPDRIFYFAWSRDGKQLALARGATNNDVILISNFKNQQ